MRLDRGILLVSLSVMCLLIANSDATSLKRTARTIPFDFSPSKLLEPITNIWRSRHGLSQFLQLPREGAVGLFKLIAGPNNRNIPMVFDFNPDQGVRASYEYQRRFGYRGEHLIEMLGMGVNPDMPFQRQHRLPVPAFALTPPLPSS